MLNTKNTQERAADSTNILSKRTFAERWGTSPRTVDNWLRAGLPHMKLSARMLRIDAAEADAWMRGKFGTQRRPSA
jgi:DNA-binding transcriptional regulator YiaG